MTILYIHCSACALNYIMRNDYGLHYLEENIEGWDLSNLYKNYIIAFYYSVCLIAGNDMTPLK